MLTGALRALVKEVKGKGFYWDAEMQKKALPYDF